jgi:three-Cys-motif partner protein
MKPRPSQTRVKHEVLEAYIDKWGGIIANGALLHARNAQSRGRDFELHLIYVDANASSGRYAGEQADVVSGRSASTVFGSPIIGIRALDRIAKWAEPRGLNVRTNSILVELEATEYGELKDSLKTAGLDHRVREGTDFRSLSSGEIALVRGDCVDVMPKIIAYTQAGRAFSLFLLDPYGPKALPLVGYVAEVIKCPRHDVIINMPYQDLHKKTGLAKKEARTAAEESVLENYDRMFSHQQWREIAQRLDRDELWEEADGIPVMSGGGEVEVELMASYRESLQNVDQTLAVKAIGLLFPDRKRTMFYLYLTTHDSDGALAINQILWDANLQEQELRWQFWQAKQEKAMQTMMLPGMDVANPVPQFPQRLQPEDIATQIIGRMAGRQTTRKELSREFADDPYFAGEINRALTILKREKRAEYESPLTNASVIHFKRVR